MLGSSEIIESVFGKFKSIEEVRDNELNIHKVVGGRFDMFVGVKLTIQFLAKKMGFGDEIEIIKMTGTDDYYLLSASKTYLAFSKKIHKQLIADEFSKTLAEMKKDGTFRKIESKYF